MTEPLHIRENCQVVDLNGPFAVVRYGDKVNEVEHVNQPSFNRFAVGETGKLLYFVHGSMGYWTFERQEPLTASKS